MTVIVPDETRKFPIAQIELISRTIDDLFQDALIIKRTVCTDWTDESDSDSGMQLLWMFSALSKLMIQTINQTAKDCFLLTATGREAMRALCRQLDYTLQEASAAVVQVRFTLEGGHPEFTIPAGTQVATTGSDEEDVVVFETIAAQLVTVGTSTVDVSCQQGETVSQEVIGSSNGTVNQVFYLQRRPVVWQSETIEVNEGLGFEAWSGVDDFSDSDSDDKHYTIDLDNDGYYYINFGDGINGKIPVNSSNNIRASYRRGGGSSGNVGAGEISELISNVDYIASLTNLTAASGGDNQETITHARWNAIASLKSLNRIVTAADVRYVLDNFTSSTYGAIGPSVAIGIDNLTIDVRFVPAIGGMPSAEFKAEVKAHLDERRMINTEIAVNDPGFTGIDYDVEIWLHDNYQQSEVVELVRQAIVAFGSPIYRNADGIYPHKFGEDVYISGLYAAIMAVTGVHRATITVPATDVTVPATYIRNINLIDIIANQGGTQSSYLNLETEP